MGDTFMGKMNKKALAISLILTIICALVLFNYVRNLQKPIEESTKTEILVSVKDINPGELVLPEDIRIIKVSPDSVPEGIIFDKTYIEGLLEALEEADTEAEKTSILKTSYKDMYEIINQMNFA